MKQRIVKCSQDVWHPTGLALKELSSVSVIVELGVLHEHKFCVLLVDVIQTQMCFDDCRLLSERH